jgi:hypothetical protein
MSYKIIVARYNEDINWLNSEISNCIIYNKGNKLNIENEILLDNVGRESETYLNYIIQNYNNLPDIVIFTQANIADHKGSNDINYLLNIKNEANQHTKSQNYNYQFDNNCNSCWKSDWNFNNGVYYLKDNYKNNSPILYIDWFKHFIQNEYPNPIKIYMNGIFAVDKKCILKHSIDYYKNLILQVNHHINPCEGHFFERSWYYIFN